MSEFLENDLVVVYISKQSRHTDKYCDFKICKVISVGLYDLICESTDSYCNKLFKISKKRCAKFHKRDLIYSEHKTHDPLPGDLVINISDSYGKERKVFTGIVENIIYDPTDRFNPIYTVRIGQETIRAYLENIIVLETSR